MNTFSHITFSVFFSFALFLANCSNKPVIDNKTKDEESESAGLVGGNKIIVTFDGNSLPAKSADLFNAYHQKGKKEVTQRAESLMSQHGLSNGNFIVAYEEGNEKRMHIGFNVGNGKKATEVIKKLREQGIEAEIDHENTIEQVPNDPMYNSNQWGLPKINAPAAWDITTGSRTIIVSVQDTGANYAHPDLYKNIYINQGELSAELKASIVDVNNDGIIDFEDLNAPENAGLNIADTNGNGYIDCKDLLADRRFVNGADNDGNGKIGDICGWNFYANTNDASDDNGHGTHVSGTIGAMSNNGLGVSGVAWKVRIIVSKHLASTGSGSSSDAANGILYAVAQGARVINGSFGGPGASSALLDAIKSAQQKGVMYIASAGNNTSNNDLTPTYPASFRVPNMLVVAATTSADAMWASSNYGPTTVDLAAPGAGIYSTLSSGSYGSYSGTSMAAPHVAGAVVLAASYSPNSTYDQIRQAIMSSVTPLASLSGKVISNGYLNLKGTLANLGASAPPPPVDSIPPTANISSPSSGASVSNIVNVNATGSDNVGVTKLELRVDGNLKNTANSSSLSYMLDSTTLTNGTHTLIVRAYDASGNIGDSSPVDIYVSNDVDSTPPSIALTSPASNVSIRKNTTYQLAATASDDRHVQRVEFYVNNKLICTDTAEPYVCNWKSPKAGNNSAQSKAFDDAGNSAVSVIRTITTQ